MKKTFLGAALICAATLTACCGGSDKEEIRLGSLSGEFDSLSYALGANIAYGIERDLNDIPFNYDRFDEGMKDGALDKKKIDRNALMGQLRDYFFVKRMERLQALHTERAKADSIRLANGDSTKVEYGSDPSLFATEGERDSISYAFGNNWGYSYRQAGAPIQIVWVLEAMKEVREGKARMTPEQMEEYIQYYFMVKFPAENAAKSEAWLNKIAKQSGVKKTESGLLYKIEKMGDTTVMPKDARDHVTVHYKGTNSRGEVFDASRFADKPAESQEVLKERFPDTYNQDEPVTMSLSQVIKGWTEGLQLVGKGGKITLWIPSDLAYGARGAGRMIRPNEALKFDIELIEVDPYVEIDTTKAVKAEELFGK